MAALIICGMEIVKYPIKENWETILKRPGIDNSELENVITGILTDVIKLIRH